MGTITTNLGLEKPASTDNVDISVINANMDVLDSSIGNKASLQTIEKGNIVGAINELFQSASNGKTVIKSAITGVDSSVSIPENATFVQLATAIGQINTGKKFAFKNTTRTSHQTSWIVDFSDLNFTPGLIILLLKYSSTDTSSRGTVGIVKYNNINYNIDNSDFTPSTLTDTSFTINCKNTNTLVTYADIIFIE